MVDVDGSDLVSDLILGHACSDRAHSTAGSKVAIELELPNPVFTSISTSEPLVPCRFLKTFVGLYSNFARSPLLKGARMAQSVSARSWCKRS